MTSKLPLLVFLLVLASSIGREVRGQATAYLLDSNLDQLFTVDLATGAATLIGSTASNGLGTPAGLAWKDDTQELWTIDLSGGEVGTIDVATGAFTPVHQTGLSGWQSIAWDPGTSLFYVSNQNGNFSSVDPVTGVVTLIGSLTYVSGMDVDAAGTLWGLRFSGGTLSTIDKSTAALTTVSTTMNSFGSLSIEQSTGTFYACNATDDSLYRIDPATGTATLVGPHGAGIQFVKGFDIADNACSGRILRRGRGCNDASGTALRASYGGAPCLGQQLDLGVTGGSQAPYLLVVGLSDSLLFGAIVLPLDLTPFGAPGCTVYTSQELILGPFAAGTQLSVQLPGYPFLVGATSHLQGFVIDPAIPTNLPLATSDYLSITLGT